MNLAIMKWPRRESTNPPPDTQTEAVKPCVEVEPELTEYLPHFKRMSGQLKETSAQIENAVVGVCDSFQGIAQRVQQTVTRATGFLSQEDNADSSKRSFETLIKNCTGTLVKILNTTEEAGEISRRAIERIRQMDEASKTINSALVQLEQIAKGNKMLAMNARIEAAHAGSQGAGFTIVATEVVSQTEKSQKVTGHISDLIAKLRALAESTLEDLQRMNDHDRKRVEESRHEVDEALCELQSGHDEMKTMLTGLTDESALLAKDIGAAVRGLQFQDRTGQRIAHVVEDLDKLHAQLSARSGAAPEGKSAFDTGFNNYTMYEERQVAGIQEAESNQGDVELF
jgi:methyl-accepting chemotaxis protein